MAFGLPHLANLLYALLGHERERGKLGLNEVSQVPRVKVSGA